MKYKFSILESVHRYKGVFIDDHTFIDENGHPYQLQKSDLSPSDVQKDNKNKDKPKEKIVIRVDRWGRRKRFVDGFGWVDF